VKKKIILGLLALVLSISLALAGCGTSTSTPSSTPATSSQPPQSTAPASSTPPTSAQPTASTSSAPVKPIELSVLYGTAKGDVSAAELDGPDGWAAELEKASGGKLKITTIYYTGQLMSDMEVYDGVINGAADIAINGTNWTPDRFPMANGLFINPLSSHTAKPSTVAREVYEKYPYLKNEFKDTHLLGIFSRTNSKYGSQLVTTKIAVRDAAGFKGLKVAAPGGFMGDTVAALGASQSMVPPFEQFQALQKGIVDGAAMDLAFYKEYSIDEIAKYQTDVNFDNNIPWYITMNKNSWAKLSPDLQDILVKTAQNYGARADNAGSKIVGAIVDDAVKNFGIEIINLSAEEMNKCVALQQPVIDNYLTKVDTLLKDSGATAKEIHDYLMSLRTKYQ
jgi:TRAP-type transport system periplasmic protein